jgi:phosphoglucosamine mutase
MLSLMKRSGKPLSELVSVMEPVPQVLLNVPVKTKPELGSLPAFETALRKSEARLNSCGRILVRYSGTEPVLRIMVEGDSEPLIRSIAEELADVVRRHVG